MSRNRARHLGRGLVFEATARDNLVITGSLSGGVTNNARTPTNRILAASQQGWDVQTPPMAASGTDVVNHHPCPVEVRVLKPGKVSQWIETDAEGKAHTFEGPLAAGQAFTLNPGDRVRFTYQEPPSWHWKTTLASSKSLYVIPSRLPLRHTDEFGSAWRGRRTIPCHTRKKRARSVCRGYPSWSSHSQWLGAAASSCCGNLAPQEFLFDVSQFRSLLGRQQRRPRGGHQALGPFLGHLAEWRVAGT